MTTTLATTFTEFNLHPGVEAAVAAMGITNPTPIQEQVIPAMMEGRDIIGQARTGSGKTLAYAIPIAELCDPTVQLTQAIVLVPTRELAIQVASVVRPLAETRRLRTILLYGGRALEPERRATGKQAADHHRYAGSCPGPPAAAHPFPTQSAHFCAGRRRRDAGPGLWPQR